jgi:prolipoprotein diacylglyceryltransferase
LNLAFPTPARSVLELGPLTIHYYALCIITGIAVAIWLGGKRFPYKTLQGQSIVSEVAIVAVPAGIIGGRIYHVVSSPNAYFGAGGSPVDAFKIWEGGLGIWGAISLGLFGAYLRYRSLAKKIELPSFAVFADALAPGILFAQAIGRFGIWCSLIAVVILKVGKSFKAGQSFALYVAAYCLGRFFIELIRIDTANTIAGLRVNVWVSVLVGAGAALYFARAAKKIQ